MFSIAFILPFSIGAPAEPPKFSVVNKCPPSFTVTNKMPAATPGVVVQRPFIPDGTPTFARSAVAPSIASSRFYRTGNTFTAVPMTAPLGVTNCPTFR